MFMPAFVETYCSDIVSEAKQKVRLLESSTLLYDAIIEIDGEQVKVVYAEDGTPIDVEDIFAFKDSAVFAGKYPSASCEEARVRYLDSFIILNGEELLEQYRRQIEAERLRIEKYHEVSGDALTCSF